MTEIADNKRGAMIARWLVLCAFCVVTLPSTVAQATETARLQAYMDRFPQSQLRDVYKYCFQDHFGLEHLMSDSMAAVRYIEYELQNSDTADWQYPLFYYPLLNGNYVRVDINYVRKGIVQIGVLVSAMLQSASGANPVDELQIVAWREEWGRMRDILNNMHPRPLNFEEDSEAIDSLLASGHYAFHHSELYNKTYRQHYRIIRRDVFEKMILPYITQ